MYRMLIRVLISMQEIGGLKSGRYIPFSNVCFKKVCHRFASLWPAKVDHIIWIKGEKLTSGFRRFRKIENSCEVLLVIWIATQLVRQNFAECRAVSGNDAVDNFALLSILVHFALQWAAGAHQLERIVCHIEEPVRVIQNERGKIGDEIIFAGGFDYSENK